ncbi:MAG TPA: SMC-Scp complex subunit ScpB [Candidatus Dormibacteraeota bacterium]|jgi:segregation and condensation protein B|nr:SMC-Scp complex subunit ScpB [Candidatus Dormibacteraeota bacterium]
MPTDKQILEAVLFASDVPVTLNVLTQVLGNRSAAEVRAVLTEMAAAYESEERGVILSEIAGGFQILSRKECAPWVEQMLRSRRKIRLSKPALESLAIVAYKQPITKVEIDSIRGVDSAGVLHTLLERNLVTIKGRSKGVGRPLLYSTTQEFLSYMGINEVTDLPELKEVAPLLEERERLSEEGEQASPEPEVEVSTADGAA